MSTPASAVATPKAAPTKKPFNRKLAVIVAVALSGLMLLVAMTRGLRDPREAAKEAADRKKVEELRSQPTGSADAGAAEVQRLMQEKVAEQRRANVGSDPDKAAFDAMLSGAPGAAGLPPIDPKLDALAQAQEEVMRTAPSLQQTASAAGLPPMGGRPGVGQGAGAASAGGSEGKPAYYENYGKSGSGIPTASELVTGTSAEKKQAAEAAGASGFYEPTKPEAPPSARIVGKGAILPAVLASRIDTRQAGPIIAIVTRTVFDSATQQVPLIPQGSKLLGRFETDVRPGVDRIRAAFSTLVLPDGRQIDLGDTQAAAKDGTIGVGGRYKSNIMRAIGPSLVVALIGQKLDHDIPSESAGGGGLNYQSPTVAQQVIPQVNQAVMQRYSAAKPYFIAAAGQEIRLILTEPLEIPAPKPGKAGGA